nr:MAG TPA: hypothetical protein [Caudoviricetes sp.]
MQYSSALLYGILQLGYCSSYCKSSVVEWET